MDLAFMMLQRLQMAFLLVSLVLLGPADVGLARDMKQYIFQSTSLHWNAVVDTCKANGARLATITSQRDYDALEELKNQLSFSVDRYWIGLYDAGPGFVWMDCSSPDTLGFSQWASGEPGTTHHCGQVKKVDTKWYSTACTDSAPFICEKDAGPCTFSEDVSNTRNDEQAPALDVGSSSTLTECKTKCNDFTSCEYIVYSAAGMCYLYASKPPGIAAGTGSDTGYTRECYTGMTGSYSLSHGTSSGISPTPTDCENVTFSTPGVPLETSSPTTTAAQRTQTELSTRATLTTTSLPSASISHSTPTSPSTSKSATISGTSPLPLRNMTGGASSQPTVSSVFGSTLSSSATTTQPAIPSSGVSTATPRDSVPGFTTALSGNSVSGTTTAPSGVVVSVDTAAPSGHLASGATTSLSGNLATGATTALSGNSASGATTTPPGTSAIDASFTYFTTQPTENSTENWPNSTIPSSANARLGNSSNGCFCQCLKPDLTPEEKVAFLDSILTRLSINTRNTSAHVRTLTSASDLRLSAKAVGYTGLVFLTIALGGIVLLDFSRLVSDLKTFKKNLKELLCSR